MRIVGKRWIGEDLPRVEYTVSTSKIKPLNFIEKQKELEKRIKKIELI
jgi:hypothetical protein